ncbi:hypothetical protein K6119_09070 [Paracrocinitomix mangrovi]|uniref:hypothetical protein n=1 Tax=Paracrocinitomix mangrovi TaxID=2862509 RepID=UPI001C8E545D|nr:hypothetical protein [Paracrocinitomix mangrovi]UKN03663.1 hypothetical protein K6119_09070 [Paracrocinitomix mangrovi]
MRFFFPFFTVLILFSCNNNDDQNTPSDQEIMRDEVRNYLFLSDTVPVKVNMVDTVSVDDLNGMLATTEENLRLIQMDIDTLGSMIDTMAYQNLAYENSLKLYPESLQLHMAPKNLELLKLRLKMAELKSKREEFNQTQRILLHLRREQVGQIAGFEVMAVYNHKGQEIEISFLMNRKYRIID